MIDNLYIEPPFFDSLQQKMLFAKATSDTDHPRMLVINNEFAKSANKLIGRSGDVVSTQKELVFVPTVLKSKTNLKALATAYNALASANGNNLEVVNFQSLVNFLELIGLLSDESDPTSALTIVKKWIKYARSNKFNRIYEEIEANQEVNAAVKESQSLEQYVNLLSSDHADTILNPLLKLIYELHGQFISNSYVPKPISWLSGKKLVIISVNTLNNVYATLVALFSLFSSDVNLYLDSHTPPDFINLSSSRNVQVSAISFNCFEDVNSILPSLRVTNNYFVTLQASNYDLFCSWLASKDSKFINAKPFTSYELESLISQFKFSKRHNQYLTYIQNSKTHKGMLATAMVKSNGKGKPLSINFKDFDIDFLLSKLHDKNKSNENKEITENDYSTITHKIFNYVEKVVQSNEKLSNEVLDLKNLVNEEFKNISDELNSKNSANGVESNPWSGDIAINRINQNYASTLKNGNSIYKQDDPFQKLAKEQKDNPQAFEFEDSHTVNINNADDKEKENMPNLNTGENNIEDVKHLDAKDIKF